MSLPNIAWDSIIGQATQNPKILEDGDTIKIVGNIMKTNVAACSSIGTYFYSQLGRIYHDMLNMYRASSQLINNAVAQDGNNPHHLSILSSFPSLLPTGNFALFIFVVNPSDVLFR